MLCCHYGPTEYQPVPDNDRGDAGIEGFTITEGHCYQAFGCKEPTTTRVRYEAQRKKMTEDISKFIRNQRILARIFGSVKISKWVLFVPYFDSREIVAHATKKTSEVVAANLPYVEVGFRVVVSQESDFPLALNQLLSTNDARLRIDVNPATQQELSTWLTTHSPLAATLSDKLRKLPTLTDERKRNEFHEKVLKWYLEGQAILDLLRHYPEMYEKVIRAKLHRENYLVMASVSGKSPQEILTSSIQELLETFREHVSTLHSFSADKLAYETVADWLLRCPLDFP